MWLLGGVLLYVSAVNAILVSEARHNLSVMPVVAATGAAGVFLAVGWLRARRGAPADDVTARFAPVSGASRGAPASPTAPR
jgi:hypothetical protein